MLPRLDQLLRELSSWQLLTISFLLVVLFAAIDHATGYELSFSVFYLIPIALSTWYAGLRQATFLSLVSAAMWLIVDITAGNRYSHALVPFWNAGVRLLFFIVTAKLLATVKSQLDKESSMARLDGLTGIMNALAFKESAQAILRIANRFGRPTAVGYIDIDDFKRVNDTLGHTEGDHLLKTVASILSASVRGADLVGRLGGDEFAVLLPETAYSGAVTVFEDLRAALLKASDRYNWPIGFSIGVAVFRTPPSSLVEAIKRADELMYRVKKSGKNRILIEAFDHPEKTDRPPR